MSENATKIATLKPTASDDIEVIFKRNGQQCSFFVAEEKFKKRGAKTLVDDLHNEFACGICCAHKQSMGECMVRCLADGQCCDKGATNCETVGD